MDRAVYKKKIRGLAQNIGKTEEELDKVVDRHFDNLEFSISNQFIDEKEKKRAQDLLIEYKENFTIENVSEKGNLHNLIFMKILINRMQNSINKIHKAGKAVPPQEIDTLNKTLDKVAQLEKELNIGGEDRDSFNINKKVMKKQKIWRDENQASRYRVCPACGESILWKIRIEAWEMQKHPFFKDRILGNTHLIKLYNEKKITARDVSNILEVGQDYVAWLITKWDIRTKAECEHKWIEGSGNVIVCEKCPAIKTPDN